MNKSLVLVVVIISILVFTGFALSQSQRQLQSSVCAEQWYHLSERERRQCQEAIGADHVLETVDAIGFATIAAQPTIRTEDILATEVAFARTLPTSIPTALPGEIPASYTVIRQLEIEEVAGTPASYKYYTSVWLNGAVIGVSGYAERLYAASFRDYCAIRQFTLDFSFSKTSDCPEMSHSISITNTNGPNGIITFTLDTTEAGTFNSQTEEWTRNGEIWQAPASSPGAPGP